MAKKAWKIIKLLTLLAVVFLAGLVTDSVVRGFLASGQATQPEASQNQLKPATTEDLLAAVNAERTNVGVAPLRLDDRLNESAQRKADDMLQFDYFAHVSPHDGKEGYAYINDAGINCSSDSENIAFNSDKSVLTTSSAMQSWENSTEHYTAMVNPAYTATGFGIINDSVVEHFCQEP